MPADEFGDMLLDDYMSSMQYVTYRFRESVLDHEFHRTEVAEAEMKPIIEMFRDIYRMD